MWFELAKSYADHLEKKNGIENNKYEVEIAKMT